MDVVFVNVAEAWLRVWTDNGVFEVRPAANGVGGPRPATTDVVLLTAWNRGGMPEEPAANDHNHRSLLAALNRHGVRHLRAALLGADASWAQPAVAAIGVTHEDAAAFARSFDQPVLTTWSNDALAIHATDGHRSETTPWTSRILTSLPCPVHPPGDHRLEPCRMSGGPYGSAAMTASAKWTSRRSSLLRSTECDVCGGGAPVNVKCRPIVLVATQDPAPGDRNVIVEPDRYLERPIEAW